jgi:uncharacterized membrane protein YhaH (DUF805 family)
VVIPSPSEIGVPTPSGETIMDFNKLWQNFVDTIQNHYMDFNGRVGRAQFWYFILVCVGINIVAVIVDNIVTGGLLRGLVGLALLLPTAGMAARRMQDTGRSGQLVWIWVIVAAFYALLGLLVVTSGMAALAFLFFFLSIAGLVGLAYLVVTIIIIYFCAQPGQAGDNQYGPPPPVWTPGP